MLIDKEVSVYKTGTISLNAGFLSKVPIAPKVPYNYFQQFFLKDDVDIIT
jgi:hypothetical protein